MDYKKNSNYQEEKKNRIIKFLIYFWKYVWAYINFLYRASSKKIKIYLDQDLSIYPRGEPPLELGVHVFGIIWNYFGIH